MHSCHKQSIVESIANNVIAFFVIDKVYLIISRNSDGVTICGLFG